MKKAVFIAFLALATSALVFADSGIKKPRKPKKEKAKTECCQKTCSAEEAKTCCLKK